MSNDVPVVPFKLVRPRPLGRRWVAALSVTLAIVVTAGCAADGDDAADDDYEPLTTTGGPNGFGHPDGPGVGPGGGR